MTAERVDIAMVLAAGLGTRMRPLTANRPKPLVALDGRTLLDRVLDKLHEAGVSRAVVNVHYHADQVEQALAGRRNPRITFSNERDELLDTGGGVARALPLLGQHPFLIHNSDSVWIEGVESNLTRLIRAWDPAHMDSLMLLAPTHSSLGFDGLGDFSMSTDGLLQRRGERQTAPFVFTGVSIAHPRLFADAPKGAFSLNNLWDRAIASKRLYGIRLEGFWMHIGTLEALAAAEKTLAAGLD